MILTFIFFILAVAVLFQPNAPRLYATGCFVAASIVHDVLFGGLSGIGYYGSAAAADLIVIILLSGVYPVSKLVVRVQLICFASIWLNFVGWLMWYQYYPPDIYNIGFTILYLVALLVFVLKGPGDVGDFELDSWRTCFRFNYFSRNASDT